MLFFSQICLLTLLTNVSIEANSVDPDQTLAEPVKTLIADNDF